MPPSPTKEATYTDHFVDLTRRPQEGHRPWLTFACTEVPPKRPEKQHPSGSLQSTPKHHPATTANDKSKGQTPQHQIPTTANSTLWGQPPHNSLSAIVMPGLHLATCSWQSRLHYNRMAHTTQTRGTSRAPGSGEHRDCTTGPQRYSLYVATLPRLGDATDLTDT